MTNALPPTKPSRFIAYYRVSTAKQGASGLGLEAQRASVASYLNGDRWELIAEFIEVESGRRNARPELAKALTTAELHCAPLIVATLDRLTRDPDFLGTLWQSEADIRIVDLPEIAGPAGRFMLRMMASVAELEAGLISSRTKAALKAAKARGKKLGGYRGRSPSDADRKAASAALVAKAERFAQRLAPTLDRLREDGQYSLGAIARELTRLGIPTARGKHNWSPSQVALVVRRLEGIAPAPDRSASGRA